MISGILWTAFEEIVDKKSFYFEHNEYSFGINFNQNIFFQNSFII
jgi:hypothetical protein